MENLEVTIDKEEELNDSESTLEANDSGYLEEVYRDKRTGNVVMHPKLRSRNQDNGRREKCWNYYIQTIREGNPSAKWAALQAGFSENTAINISKMAWFKERKDKLRRSRMLNNAERNIAHIINLKLTKMKTLPDGSQEEVFDPEKAKIVADLSKTIVTTLGKDLGYSTKTEVKVTEVPKPIMEIDSIDITNPQLETNDKPMLE